MEDQPRNNARETGFRKPPVEHQFKPGNPGRPKGSRNKLGEAFLEALHDDFQKHGAQAIVECRTEKPEAYVRVIAGLLPQEVKLSVEQELTDEQLVERIRQLEAVIRPFLVDGIQQAPDRGEEAPRPH